MSHTTFFVQECPTCGRRLQIRVVYLGRRLYCQHCGGRFLAADSAAGSIRSDLASSPLLDRADELLAFAEQQKSHAPIVNELPAF